MFYHSKSKSVNFAKLHELAEDFFGKLPLAKERKRRKLYYRIFKYVGLGVALFFSLAIIFLAAHYFTLKQIYNEAMAGKNDLEQAVIFAREQNFKQAVILSGLAGDHFETSLSQLDRLKSKVYLRRTPIIKNQVNDLAYLLFSANLLSRAVNASANLGLSLNDLLAGGKNFNYSKLSSREKVKILRRIYESTPEMTGIKADLDLASINLSQIGGRGILWPVTSKINSLKSQVNQAAAILEKAAPITQILPAMAGYPRQTKFLFILQNNDELRPTGGFIGTYGIMEFKDGDLVKFFTDDVYHLDMPARDKFNVAPPPPIKKYLGVNKWYLRDANWSPDWPIASQKIKWFYQTEKKLLSKASEPDDFDGVIAITPQVITDLLAITGPISLEGVSYNKDNFQNLLQYRVEKGYLRLGMPSWQRKEVIGEIARELKERIFDTPIADWLEIFNVFNNNFTQKNILVHFNDNALENLVKQQGWGGEVKSVAGDYLYVVDSNMASFKTDAVMSRRLDYKVEAGVNGLFAKLRLSYAHHGNFDWKTTTYRSYTRIYVPLGSQLIKADNYSLSEIEVNNELGKTSFGVFFTVEPGKIKSLSFEYKLPDDLSDLYKKNYYSLFIQKQPGNDTATLTVDLNFANDIKLYSPISLSARRLGSARVNWESDLSMDRSFSIGF